MAFKEYGKYDAVGLAELVRKKQVSAQELLDEAIARTAKVDPQINAVVVKHYDHAKKQVDKGLPDGPFTGVPFLLKDLDLLQGTVTTFGASIYRNNVADHTGTLAQRFLDTGVAIFGKSSSPEFGLMPTTESRLFGPTRNPWNLAHSSGGSSGGAAAAVAARILPMAHASDGGGSIRIPASASGVFGLKPTRARNPLGTRPRRRLGRLLLRPCGEHQRARQRRHDGRHPGAGDDQPLCGAGAGAAVRAGSRPRPRHGCASPSPIARPMAMPSIPRSPRPCATWPRMLGKLGHHVEERAPKLPADPAAVMAVIVGANTALTVRMAEAVFGRQMTDQDFEMLTLAMSHNSQQDQRHRLCRSPARRLPHFARARRILRDLRRLPVSDAVLAAGEDRRAQHDVERPLARSRRSCGATCRALSMFNMSGQPAMSVPLAWNKAGLPLGMMFSARLGDEATLFRLAGSARAGAALEGQIAAGMRVSTPLRGQNSALFAREERDRRGNGDTDSADGVIESGGSIVSKQRSDRPCAGGHRQHSRQRARRGGAAAAERGGEAGHRCHRGQAAGA